MASFVGPVTIGMDVLGPVAICLGLYLPILPSAMLAWSEPNESADDDAAPVVEAAGR